MAIRQRVRPAVLVAYAAFVLLGISGGVSGVLLPAQMTGYGVDRATIGIMFFAGSAGFVLAGLSNGALIARLGIRVALAAGAAMFALSGLCLATGPPLALFMAAQLLNGYGCGVLESVLSVYLAAQPDSRTLLNRLHAFFGVGALIGPAFAAWLLGLTSWPAVWLILGLAGLPLTIGVLAAHPRREPAAPELAVPGDLAAGQRVPEAPGPEPGASAAGLLGRALRDPGVLLGAAMLGVYVGLELSVGNWGFSYLVQARAMPRASAGWALSGFWLGLTLGRFLISPAAERLRATTAAMMYACLGGATAAILGTWLSPTAATAVMGLVLLGFFLGPVFPTTMAAVPQLAPAELGPTAFGVMNTGSVVGGSGLPWLAGTITQGTGMGALLPFCVVLAVLQFAVWRPIARRIRTMAPALPAGAEPSSAGSR
jgi:fucose permease